MEVTNLEKTCVSWSGGRDSTMMLDALLQNQRYNVEGLLTTFLKHTQKMMMHEVPFRLVEKQAKALGLPLYPVLFEESVSNDEYEETMRKATGRLEEEGFTEMSFGDLHLEDIRKYRETQMKKSKIAPIFPLWGKNTRELSELFISKGYKALIVCVDSEQLGAEFLGREYNQQLLEDIPSSVDPCGENGEFHSFVYDGPLFQTPVEFEINGTYTKFNRFCYLDL
jgi:uncharacterized protein (TIGR00290 family)